MSKHTKVLTVTFERDAEDAQVAEEAQRTDAQQLSAELQEACDAGILNGFFKVDVAEPGRADVLGFVRAVIDTDAHTRFDAIDVAGVVLAVMSGDKYRVDAEDHLAAWAKLTFSDEFLARVFDIRGRNDGFRWTLSERQIACLRSASLGYATRAKYQALPEAEQRALLDLINEPCSDHPWLTPQGKVALSQVKS